MAGKAKPSLADQIKAKQPSVPVPEGGTKKAAAKKAGQPGRVGMKHVGGYYPSECLKAVKLVSLEEEQSIQSLVAQALNLLLESKGKAPIFPTD